LQKERAEVWRAATRWMSFAELLALRLCGESKASVSMASGTGLFDLRSCDWDAPLLRELKLDANQLPLIAGDGETLTLAARYGERWPQLRRGCAFFPAVGDGAANNIGEGCASRSRAALMIGTSAAMRVVYEGAAPSELDESLWCYRVDRKRVVVGGALSDGGGLYAWLTDALALSSRAATGEHERTTDSAEIERALDVSGPDSHGLTMLPFWAGERSTGWHTSARGAILGLTMHTRPIEILRACMESIAYRCAVIADALEAHAPGMSLRASGGALRASPAWARILADALGRPLALSRVREASSRGAVLLALEAMGAIKSVTEFPVEAGEVFEPDEARHALYRKGLERQQRIYELLVNDSEVARLLSEAGE
jgi:gluconokinase